MLLDANMQDRSRLLKLARMAASALGTMMVVVALLADWIGLDSSDQLSRGEILLLMAGLTVLLLGIFGRRFVAGYRATAIILLNTLVLCAVLELASIAISTLNRNTYRPPRFQERLEQLLSRQSGDQAYWQEHSFAVRQNYHPYVLWRSAPFHGNLINVDKEGWRVTPDNRCGGECYQVFLFGGSAMWGWGAPDSRTIPAFLQSELARMTTQPICVRNFAQNAFVSTQSLIEFTLQLQRGNVPNLAIFYDGINDIFAAYQSGEAGVHQQLAQIANSIEGRENPLLKWLKDSEFFSVLESRRRRMVAVAQMMEESGTNAGSNQLVDSVANVYLSNYRIVGALAKEYGFSYIFFWQPHISTDPRRLTKEESTIKDSIDQNLALLCRSVYRRVEEAARREQNLCYLGNVFQGHESTIWMDPWGHLVPNGNQIVARAISKCLEKRVLALASRE